MGNYTCIRVIEDDGFYQINPDADPEDWYDVVSSVDRVEFVENLRGWGYKKAYRAYLDDVVYWYFVEEEQ